MSRKHQRAASLLFLFAVAGLLVHLGFQSWTFSDLIPAQYLGYVVGAFGVLGLFGVNVWYGGPLDPREDPPPDEQAEQST